MESKEQKHCFWTHKKTCVGANPCKISSNHAITKCKDMAKPNIHDFVHRNAKQIERQQDSNIRSSCNGKTKTFSRCFWHNFIIYGRWPASFGRPVTSDWYHYPKEKSIHSYWRNLLPHEARKSSIMGGYSKDQIRFEQPRPGRLFLGRIEYPQCFSFWNWIATSWQFSCPKCTARSRLSISLYILCHTDAQYSVFVTAFMIQSRAHCASWHRFGLIWCSINASAKPSMANRLDSLIRCFVSNPLMYWFFDKWHYSNGMLLNDMWQKWFICLINKPCSISIFDSSSNICTLIIQIHATEKTCKNKYVFTKWKQFISIYACMILYDW